MLECAAKAAGTWSYLAAIGPTALAALTFTILALKTHELRQRVGAVWWLIPLEAARNAATAYDNGFWLLARAAAACGGPPPELAPAIDNEIKIALGLTAMTSIWIYYWIRAGR